MGLAEYDEALEAYALRQRRSRPDRYIRGLEATVDRLIDRLDRLEDTVLALCEQDGEVTYEKDPHDND